MDTILDLLRSTLPDVGAEMSQAAAGWAQFAAGVITLFVAQRALWVSHADAESARAMLRHQQETSAEDARPRVILDFAGDHAVARNVGRGAAVNAYYLRYLDSNRPEPLGSVLPGQEVPVYDALNVILEGEVASDSRHTHYVVAQAATTTDWVATVSRVNSNGRMTHEYVQWTPNATQLKEMRNLTFLEQVGIGGTESQW